VKPAGTADEADALLRHAERDALAGVFARRPGSVYRPGKRTDDLLRIPTPAAYR
jgi:ATP-dependent DNA ligase